MHPVVTPNCILQQQMLHYTSFYLIPNLIMTNFRTDQSWSSPHFTYFNTNIPWHFFPSFSNSCHDKFQNWPVMIFSASLISRLQRHKSHNTFFPTSPFLPSLWHPRRFPSLPIMISPGSFSSMLRLPSTTGVFSEKQYPNECRTSRSSTVCFNFDLQTPDLKFKKKKTKIFSAWKWHVLFCFVFSWTKICECNLILWDIAIATYPHFSRQAT